MSAADDARRNGDRIVDAKLDRLGRAVAFETIGRLMDATPVDIGRARGNWNLSRGAEDVSTDPDRRAPAALAQAQARVASVRMSQGDKVYLTNGLPYIGKLNDGHSRQAPAAFIQLVVQRMQSFVLRAARQEGRRG
jgi:hypothetical protein